MDTNYDYLWGNQYSDEEYVYFDKRDLSHRDIYRNIKDSIELGSIYFRASQYSFGSKRNFARFNDLLSYIGGLFNSIYVSIGLVIMAYGRY